MDLNEYNSVKDFSYEQYCDYLKKKYLSGKLGLFKHHVYENIQANLSNNEIRNKLLKINPGKEKEFNEKLFIVIILSIYYFI